MAWMAAAGGANRYFRRRRSSSPRRDFARHLNDVATQLGFRRQAVYHYFRSKDQIPYELIDRAGQAIATSAQSTLDADMPPTNKIAEVVRNHVRQLLRNIDIVRIQFSELFKLHEKRADGLRRDMSAYVRSIANVIKEGQKDGTFSTYHPRRKCTCDSSRGGRRWRRRRLAEPYAAAACSTASKVAALCSAW